MPSFRKLCESFWKMFHDARREAKRSQSEEYSIMIAERQIWKLEPEQYYFLFKTFGPGITEIGNEAIKEVRRVSKQWVDVYRKELPFRNAAMDVFLETWCELLEHASLIEDGKLGQKLDPPGMPGVVTRQMGGAYTVAAMYIWKLDYLMEPWQVYRLTRLNRLPFLDLSIENLSAEVVEVPSGVMETLEALEALPHREKIIPYLYGVADSLMGIVNRAVSFREKQGYVPVKKRVFGVPEELLQSGVPVDELPALHESIALEAARLNERKALIEVAKSKKMNGGPSMLEIVEKAIELIIDTEHHRRHPERLETLQRVYEEVLHGAEFTYSGHGTFSRVEPKIETEELSEQKENPSN